jgi:predicted AlkP superfamily pyrophosphatase or phosphodiesterase
MRIVLLLILLGIFKSYAQTPTVLISIDGFAQHYLSKYQPPTLLALAKSGVSTKSLLPVFPTKTFPNHLSMVTGKYPGEHGIINNYFYDLKAADMYRFGKSNVPNQWLKAEPIWVTLEKNNVKTAAYFWPESDISFNGILPSYFFSYNKTTPFKQRLKQIVDWLALPDAERPLFIATYTNLIDEAGHDFGIDSKQVGKAIKDVDRSISWLVKKLKQLKIPVNIILVSDHGMVNTDKNNAVLVDELIKSVPKDVKIVNGATQLFVYSENKSALNSILTDITNYKATNTHTNFEVITNDNFPSQWHFNKSSSHIPQIVLNAIAPTAFTYSLESLNPGEHGYSPRQSDNLNAIFIASGPDFKNSVLTAPFENIHIHTLLVKLYDLPSSNKDEKCTHILKQILVK